MRIYIETIEIYIYFQSEYKKVFVTGRPRSNEYTLPKNIYTYIEGCKKLFVLRL